MSASDNLFKLAARIEKLSATEPMIMYHGTRGKNIQSILSQGLIPNPKQRTWHSDENAGWYSPSRASLDGVYLTTNLMTAIGSASNGPMQKTKNVGLVIVEVHPNNLIADEDDFKFSVESIALKEYNPGPLHACQMYFDYLLNGDGSEYFSKSRDAWVKKQIDMFEYLAGEKGMHTGLKARFEELLQKGFILVLKRKCAYADDYTWRQAWDHMNNERGKAPPPMLNKDEAERGFLQFTDLLTRAGKRAFARNDGERYTARTLNPIGFTGRNKILAVLEIDNTYRAGEPTQIFTVYPSSWNEVPSKAKQDFLSQWKSRYGSDIKFM